jgi:archaellum biogenesis ATPase FlaH
MLIDIKRMDKNRIDNVVLQDTKKMLSLSNMLISQKFPYFKIDNLENIIVSYIKDLKYIINDASTECKKELLVIIYDALSYCMCKDKWEDVFNYIKKLL